MYGKEYYLLLSTIRHKRVTQHERNKMENRTDRASVNAHGSLRGGLSQIHGRTDGVVQHNVLSKALLSAS